jgi:hypothetical protein
MESTEEETVYPVTAAEFRADAHHSAIVYHKEVWGFVDDIERGMRTSDLLYFVRWEDDCQQHCTQDELEEIIVPDLVVTVSFSQTQCGYLISTTNLAGSHLCRFHVKQDCSYVLLYEQLLKNLNVKIMWMRRCVPFTGDRPLRLIWEHGVELPCWHSVSFKKAINEIGGHSGRSVLFGDTLHMFFDDRYGKSEEFSDCAARDNSIRTLFESFTRTNFSQPSTGVATERLLFAAVCGQQEAQSPTTDI